MKLHRRRRYIEPFIAASTLEFAGAMRFAFLATFAIAAVHGGVIRSESSALTTARATDTRPTSARAELRRCRAQVRGRM
eukprot:scaffold54818_cov77-Phaeocystis_antarctica.AAC.1